MSVLAVSAICTYMESPPTDKRNYSCIFPPMVVARVLYIWRKASLWYFQSWSIWQTTNFLFFSVLDLIIIVSEFKGLELTKLISAEKKESGVCHCQNSSLRFPPLKTHSLYSKNKVTVCLMSSAICKLSWYSKLIGWFSKTV